MKVRQKLVNCSSEDIPSTSKGEIVSAKDCEKFLEFIDSIGITDDPKYSRSFGYYMGLILGPGDLSVVKPIIRAAYPKLYRYLTYWVSTHSHGLENYRIGVKDSMSKTLLMSTMYLRHFHGIKHL